jgi:hypothetical protein
MRWAGHIARMPELRCAYRIVVEILEGKRPLGSHRHGQEDSIKRELREIVREDVDLIYLSQDREQ